MDESESRKTATVTAWLLGLMGGIAILGLLGIAYLIGFNQGENESTTSPPAAERPAQEQTTTPAAASEAGKELFTQSCGSCHTLADAGTTGATGPNLDQLQPDEAQVSAAIANGGTGSGAMPKGLYAGKQAQEVAQYVSSVAGQ
jgi:mono/diheme cytochrome c family protein